MDVALVGVCEPKNAFLLLDTTLPHATRLLQKNGVAQKRGKQLRKSSFFDHYMGRHHIIVETIN